MLLFFLFFFVLHFSASGRAFMQMLCTSPSWLAMAADLAILDCQLRLGAQSNSNSNSCLSTSSSTSSGCGSTCIWPWPLFSAAASGDDIPQIRHTQRMARASESEREKARKGEPARDCCQWTDDGAISCPASRLRMNELFRT